MKGGKQGRPRRSTVAKRDIPSEMPRGKPKPGAPSRSPNVAPKKGSRKRPNVGGTSTSGEE